MQKLFVTVTLVNKKRTEVEERKSGRVRYTLVNVSINSHRLKKKETNVARRRYKVINMQQISGKSEYIGPRLKDFIQNKVESFIIKSGFCFHALKKPFSSLFQSNSFLIQTVINYSRNTHAPYTAKRGHRGLHTLLLQNVFTTIIYTHEHNMKKTIHFSRPLSQIHIKNSMKSGMPIHNTDMYKVEQTFNFLAHIHTSHVRNPAAQHSQRRYPIIVSCILIGLNFYQGCYALQIRTRSFNRGVLELNIIEL